MGKSLARDWQEDETGTRAGETADLSAGADQGGLQLVAGAPRVLVLPHHVRGRVVGSIPRSCPDLQRSQVTQNHQQVSWRLLLTTRFWIYSAL